MNTSIQKFDVPQNEIASIQELDWLFGRGKRLEITLKNGWGLSCICSKLAYSNGKDTFEVGIQKGGKLTDANPFGEEILGYQTAADIKLIVMKLIALNKLEA